MIGWFSLYLNQMASPTQKGRAYMCKNLALILCGKRKAMHLWSESMEDIFFHVSTTSSVKKLYRFPLNSIFSTFLQPPVKTLSIVSC